MIKPTKPTPHQTGTTTPGPRKQSVHGGAEVTQRARPPKRVEAGLATRATPPLREPTAVTPQGPRSLAAAANARKR